MLLARPTVFCLYIYGVVTLLPTTVSTRKLSFLLATAFLVDAGSCKMRETFIPEKRRLTEGQSSINAAAYTVIIK